MSTAAPTSGLRSLGAALRARPDRSAWIAIGALVFVGTVIRVPQLFHNIAEAFAFRQSQTAFVVREFADHGINLLSTPLPVFGPDANVPMEFPLFQAIASLLVHLGLDSTMASRTLGLVGFIGTGLLLGVLLTRWHGRVVAIVGVALLEFIPYGLLWGASSLIDFFSVAFSLLMVVGIDGFFSRRPHAGWWLAAGILGSIIAFLVKVTTAPAYGILLVGAAIVIIRQQGWAASWRRLLVGFVAGPGVGLALSVAWTVYADRIKAANPLTDFLTSSSLRSWNFGTTAERLDPVSYLTIVTRIGEEMAGPAAILLVLAIVAVFFQRDFRRRVLLATWIGVVVITPLVFFNLYVVHSYYLIAIYPAVVSAMAIAGVWLFRLLPLARVVRVALAGVTTVGLFAFLLTSPAGHADAAQWRSNNAIPAISSLLLDQTPPGAQIIFVGCDWDPTFLYYAQRTGMMFREGDAGDTWSRQNIADYGYLFDCRADLDPAGFLPSGYVATPTSSAGFFTVARG